MTAASYIDKVEENAEKFGFLKIIISTQPDTGMLHNMLSLTMK